MHQWQWDTYAVHVQAIFFLRFDSTRSSFLSNAPLPRPLTLSRSLPSVQTLEHGPYCQRPIHLALILVGLAERYVETDSCPRSTTYLPLLYLDLDRLDCLAIAAIQLNRSTLFPEHTYQHIAGSDHLPNHAPAPKLV